MRRPLVLLVLAAVATASTGCLDAINPFSNGIGPGEWPLEMLQVPSLWEKGRTGAGVKVAVIDTGIDRTHPEFEGVVVEWADLVNNRAEPYDDNGHGTHVASIIVARGSWKTALSGFYVQGVAQGVSLIVIKAIAASGTGEETTVARAINIAVDPNQDGNPSDGADIVVLSLGGGSFPLVGTQTEQAVRNAANRGVLVVAAAGNAKQGEASCDVTSPASETAVVAVGAVDESRRLAGFSCRGKGSGGPIPVLGGAGESDPHKKPEVVAPGVGIMGAWREEQYVEASGTSQAAPFVGGILALILEGHGDLRRTSGRGIAIVNEVKCALALSTAKIGPLGGKGAFAHDPGYGYGLVQAAALDAQVATGTCR